MIRFKSALCLYLARRKSRHTSERLTRSRLNRTNAIAETMVAQQEDIDARLELKLLIGEKQ